MKLKHKNWLAAGFLTGLVTPLFMTLLSKIPMLEVTFSTIAVDLRSKIVGYSGVNLYSYLLGLIGVDFSLPAIIMSGIGGAILIYAARYLSDYIPFKTKGQIQFLVKVFLIASLLQFLIFIGIGIPSFSVIFGFIVNAIVMAYVVSFVAKELGLKLD